MENDIIQGYPQSVYKYYSLSDSSFDNSLNSFLYHYLFVGHPFLLNDLMDGVNYTLDMRSITAIESFQRLKQEVIHNTPSIGDYFDLEQISLNNKNGLYLLSNAINNSYFAFGGIISLATDRFNELMWSHYTNETGFMIELDTKLLIRGLKKLMLNYIFDKLIFNPVQYKEYPKSINCNFYNIHEINILNVYQKHKSWSYEKEWRLLVTSKQFLGIPESLNTPKSGLTNLQKRKFYYTDNTIKRVFLGKKFWEKHSVISEERLGENIRKYVVQEKYLPFIKKLSDYNGFVYMAGACDCSEYRHGSDACVYNITKKQCDFYPNYYYLTRSFELIKIVDIKGKTVTVEYDGKVKTRDEDFE